MAEDLPLIVAETPGYLVAYKPRGMHSAPLSEGEADTLLAWCGALRPEVLAVAGRKSVERGLLHRLDRDTAGLVLLAKSQAAYDALSAAQEDGSFVKEYEAICLCPEDGAPFGRKVPFAVESAFRPYGPGRRLVRAVEVGAAAPKGVELAWDRGRPYRTEVLSIEALDDTFLRVSARLRRGFRHQVRCHLSWIGIPIRGDELYGRPDGTPLGLTAVALSFPDPLTGALAEYCLPQAGESAAGSEGR